ncbi:MAG: hypothetical protein HQ575_06125 [Candidatus Omnitrophica bacterium]|nr:hypothetical protein [Candidatus Omnitrophota bacterium]
MATSKNIGNFIYILLPVLFIVLCASGCAEINLFKTPVEVLKHPLGTDLLRTGMSKEEVISRWGKSDQINKLDPTDEWQTEKAEWVYIGRYSKVPLDRSYFFKTKYLVFDGNHLVSFGNASKCKDLKR